MFNEGQIIAVAVPKHESGYYSAPEWALKAAAESGEDFEDMLVTDFHDPNSFQDVEAFIRSHLDVDAEGSRLPRLPSEA